MSKKDFKRYMLQGLGRCNIVLQKSEKIEKYKDIVLWGCLHNLSFDAQCEGTRADYVYKLTKYFDDEEYFSNPIVEAYEKYKSKDLWQFHHLTWLLQCFASEENEIALNALHKKYKYLLSRLINKRSFTGYDFERDFFEAICFSLKALGGIDELLKIAYDMGELFEKNHHYSGSSFDWFCSQMSDSFGERKLNSILKLEAKKSKYIKIFYENYKDALSELRSFIKTPIEPLSAFDIKKEIDEKETFPLREIVLFKRLSDDTEKEKLAKIIIDEPNEDKKAELLSTFTNLKMPFLFIPHNIIIEYAKSTNEKLKDEAINVLTECVSDEARAFGFELLKNEDNKNNKSQAIKILLRNYTKIDKEFLLSLLKNIKVEYDEETGWHNIGLKILELDDSGVKLPKEFLLYIYNTTLCSSCREGAVRALSKRRALTRDIIEECRFDSNDDISAYVNRYFKEETSNDNNNYTIKKD